MQNFEYFNPTRIIFGKGTIPQIGQATTKYGRKALLVYGKGTIKQIGVYDQVVNSLKKSGIEIVEFGGVRPNPILSHLREGVTLAKKERVDVIVAVGGGSAIDEAKAIAAGVKFEGDVWDIFVGGAKVVDSVPLVSVLTVAATGTEMNGAMVITDEESGFKTGLALPTLYPKVSILDPSTTCHLPIEYTACGAVDAFSHISEGYFTQSDDNTPLQDGMVETIVRTLVECMDILANDPRDYQARANMMWTATLAWNGLANSGTGTRGIPCHALGHPISGCYNTPHGATLAIVTPRWLRTVINDKAPRIAKFACNVFGIQEDEMLAAEKGLEAIENWFSAIGVPRSMKEAGIADPDFDKLADSSLRLMRAWGIQDQWDLKSIRQLFMDCA